MTTRKRTILCLAGEEKGYEFIRTCHAAGWKVVLLTSQSRMAKSRWPRECIDELFEMPDDDGRWDRLKTKRAVSYLARTRVFDRIVPFDDLDLEVAAMLREHLRVPGLGDTATRYFRDKLAMRMAAREAGFLVPDFVHLLNDAAVAEFVANVPPPWMVKPRFLAGTLGIHKVKSKEELLATYEQLGDERSNYLAERWIPGRIFHVESLVNNEQQLFARASAYGRPPFEVANEGDVFSTQLLPAQGEDARAIVGLNEKVLKALNFDGGVTHSEYIRGADDDRLYFLETAARVAGAYIPTMVEAATGVSLWEEWARVEMATVEGAYALPAQRDEYAGLVIALARSEHPDTSSYTDPEIVWRLDYAFHVGFVVRATTPERVAEVMSSISTRVRKELLTSAPPKQR